MSVDAPKCNVLSVVYDYTTRRNMDISIDKINSDFLKQDFLSKNLCDLSVGCVVDDEICNTDSVVVDLCKLNITTIVVEKLTGSETDKFTFTPTVVNNIGTIAYEWEFPLREAIIGCIVLPGCPIDPVLELFSGTDNISSTLQLDWANGRPYGNRSDITLLVTDERGCIATKHGQMIYDSIANTVVLNFSLVSTCEGGGTICGIASSDTTITISQCTGLQSLYTSNVRVCDTLLTTILFEARGITLPFMIDGLTPGTPYIVMVRTYCSTIPYDFDTFEGEISTLP